MCVSALFFLASFSLIIFACTLKMIWLIIALPCLIAGVILRKVWHVSSPQGSFDDLMKMEAPEKQAAEKKPESTAAAPSSFDEDAPSHSSQS